MSKGRWLTGSRVYIVVILLAAAGCLAALLWKPAVAAVTLVDFQASGEAQGIRLRWETASELDNSGFFVQRSTTQETGYQRVNTLIIPAAGDLIGAHYQYLDSSVLPGIYYFYRLEAIDIHQQSQVFGPVYAVKGLRAAPSPTGGSPTLTPSPTMTQPFLRATATATATTEATSSPQSGTSTATTTPTVTAPAPYPGLTNTPASVFLPDISGSGMDLTETPGSLFIPSVSGSSGVTTSITATWIPFPEVTMIFPTRPSVLVTPTIAVDSSLNQGGVIRSALSWWPLGVLLVVWGGLAAWFWVVHRRG